MDDEVVRRVVAAIDPAARLIRWWPIAGGLGSRMTALELSTGRHDAPERVVALRWRPEESSVWPSLPIPREYDLLRELDEAGLPVPPPLLVEGSPELLGHPFMVVGFVAGSPRFSTADPVATAVHFGEVLAHFHVAGRSLPVARSLPAWQERAARVVEQPPGDVGTAEEQAALAAVAASWPPPPPPRPTVLHGDYWAGNVVWQGDRIAAVIDWEEAGAGDPLADVAIARLDLLWAFGADAMDAFTAAYLDRSGTDPALLPFWDLVAGTRPIGVISRWASVWPAAGRPDITAASMRADHRTFLRQALERA